jgi:SAM-dependent methyltransferase
MRDFAMLQGEGWGWQAAGQLLHTVCTGETALSKVHGMGLFEFLARNPRDAELFNRAMTGYSASAIPAIVAAYDYSQFGTLVDVGGGHGSLLAAILAAHPRVRGVLFDLPSVIKEADRLDIDAGVRERTELAAGDFFESVPSGADAYLMKNIIHDWDDTRATIILQHCRRGINPNGKLLLVELLLPAPNTESFAPWADLEMLVMTQGGRERTESEYSSLFAAAGFRLSRVIPTESPFSVIEGVPAG